MFCLEFMLLQCMHVRYKYFPEHFLIRSAIISPGLNIIRHRCIDLTHNYTFTIPFKKIFPLHYKSLQFPWSILWNNSHKVRPTCCAYVEIKCQGYEYILCKILHRAMFPSHFVALRLLVQMRDCFRLPATLLPLQANSKCYGSNSGNASMLLC